MKKLIAGLLAIIMIVSGIVGYCPDTVKADVTAVLPITYVSDMSELNDTVGRNGSYAETLTFTKDEDGKSKTAQTVTLTLEEPAIVCLDAVLSETGGGDSYGYVNVYTNPTLAERVYREKVSTNGGDATTPGTTRKYIALGKGTFYVVMTYTRKNPESKDVVSITGTLYATAVKSHGAITTSIEECLDGTFDISIVDNHIANCVTGIYYSNDLIYSNFKQVSLLDTTFNVSGEDTWHIMLCFNNKYMSDGRTTFVCYTIKTKKADETVPKISGVESSKTYTKAVTIKFSDKESGIASATLNGKTIKSGKKVLANGTYTLIVTDKAGNSNTIKFTIKIKK